MPAKKRLSDYPLLALATGLGSGFSPVAPGTAGSFVGLGLFLLVSDFEILFYLLFTAAVTLAGIPISSHAEKFFGEKDSQKIVLDEIAGILITFIAVPAEPLFVIAGFLLFRFFDIWKPFKRLEKLQGGLGVMMDDVAAGIYACVVLHGVILFADSYPAL